MNLLEAAIRPSTSDRERSTSLRAATPIEGRATGETIVGVDGGYLSIDVGNGVPLRFHAEWLRDRSQASFDVDRSNRQRLFEPHESGERFAIESVEHNGAHEIDISFSDGRRRVFSLVDLAAWAHGAVDADRPPEPEPWERLDALPELEWAAVIDSDDHEMARALGEFHRLGCFVITGTPTAPGSLRQIAGSFGRVSATNFGELFDVESVPNPADLAYTPVGLSAHTDQPYRCPTPGLQFLHTLVNDAPGGESTVVDGLAAIRALRDEMPAGYDLLTRLPVEFRYDIGTDVVVNEAPIIDLHLDGTLRQLRFSPRLDFVPYTSADVLDLFYDARRRLANRLNDPAHQVCFKMSAGDVIVVDNHRVLHGRTAFDPTVGRRHLQGCYIDHDGPATLYRLLHRRLTTAN